MRGVRCGEMLVGVDVWSVGRAERGERSSKGVFDENTVAEEVKGEEFEIAGEEDDGEGENLTFEDDCNDGDLLGCRACDGIASDWVGTCACVSICACVCASSKSASNRRMVACA